jgi:hypothetical protein
MIMLSGPWLGASGAACAAPADTPKMKASAISLFIRFLPAFPLPHRIMAPATSRRKEGIRLFPHPRTFRESKGALKNTDKNRRKSAWLLHQVRRCEHPCSRKLVADQKFACDVLKVDSTTPSLSMARLLKGTIAFEDFEKKIKPMQKK